MALRATVTSSGRLSLPAELRRKHGLTPGSTVIVEDRGDAIVIRTFEQSIAHAQAIARRLMAGREEEFSTDAFLAERRKDGADE